MIQLLIITLAALSVGFVPISSHAEAQAQARPEEALERYEVTFLKFVPGAEERWRELMARYYLPAVKAAGLPVTQVHWLAEGEWDVMLLREFPSRVPLMDAHKSPERSAYEDAFANLAGSEAAAKALNEEITNLIASSRRFHTHTRR